MQESIIDYPKIKSPFVRERIEGRYIVTPQIEKGYEWVFEDDAVRAVDKLHGTNVCIIIRDGVITSIHNRTQVVMAQAEINTRMSSQLARAVEGVVNGLKYLKNLDGRIYGELIGPQINGNIHRLDRHVFIPFDYLSEVCHWKSWVRGDYPKTYQAISKWFKYLPSLYTKRATGIEEQGEGIVFTHPDGRKAKLRRSMFDWYSEAK